MADDLGRRLEDLGVPDNEIARILEEGRQLASERDNLIAQGVDPADLEVPIAPLPLHRTEAGYPNCSTCNGGGCSDCTDPA